ncbi:MAG: DNA ligase D [Syntrophomonas sp.]|nr:DNA ligase D [Syntrophomonas sp.]
MEKNDPLVSYKEKRDFTKTSEPPGEPAVANPSWSFVVQKHEARSTHYDLRLELDGVLKSWAVPKGPSLAPGEKRLAVQVEDHPLAYLNFEGTIPAHQYGAGTVLIWDRGTWEPVGDPHQSLASGQIKFNLYGQKLQGAWVLVQMRPKNGGKKEWLLIKEGEGKHGREKESHRGQVSPPTAQPDVNLLSLPSGASRAEVPARLAPQLATLVDRVPNGDDWIYEIKLDGYRILTRVDTGAVTIYTRNGLDWTSKLGSLVEPLQALRVAPGWLDGEIVVLGGDDMPDFAALQAAFEAGCSDEIVYFIFDMPFYAGYDLRRASLLGRRALLSQVLRESTSARLRFSADFTATGADILSSACSIGLEGVMGKRKESAYVSGRSPSWIKLKCRPRQEFIIVGYTPSSAPGRAFRSLLMGVHDEAGHLHYAGKVGTGFNALNSAAIKEGLDYLATDRSPLLEVPKGVEANWVRPEMVAEVSFAAWTRDGLIRQAAFQGLRRDKRPDSIIREQPANPALTGIPGKQAKPGRPRAVEPPSYTITNPDRVVDKTTSFTKLNLATYYQMAAPWILPHLRERPVSFLRAPEGLGGEFFFQKHGVKMKIPGLTMLDPALNPGHPAMMSIDSEESLIGAVQMNVIEFHTWNATVKNIDKPDRMVFDLDPGEGVAWPVIMEAAELTRALLEELELQCFLKTSGGKGLHVVVPLKPRDDWETVKTFSKGVAAHLTRIIPDYFTDISGPRNRIGKVFIDYNRNSRGATTVAAWSVRARPGMGVSMPCSWEELRGLTSGAHWTIANADLRLDSGQDPWKEYRTARQILKAASKKLMLPR